MSKIIMTENETSADGNDQSFGEWLTGKLEGARGRYHDGPRSENSRQSDIALGRLRAYRDARTEYLNRTVNTDVDRSSTDK